MSINTTPFLHLPQWTEQEHPSFLSEMNQAYASIDSGYGDIKTIAQTGVSSSQEAMTTANGAKNQSEANAGAITLLQQKLEQLEAEFIEASSLKTITLEGTPGDNFTINHASVIYNKFSAVFKFSFSSTNWAQVLMQTGNITLGAFTNIPFTYKSVDLHGGFSFPLALKTGELNLYDQIVTKLNNDGTVILANGPGIKNMTGSSSASIEIYACIPIFQNTTARPSLPDNCLFTQN